MSQNVADRIKALEAELAALHAITAELSVTALLMSYIHNDVIYDAKERLVAAAGDENLASMRQLYLTARLNERERYQKAVEAYKAVRPEPVKPHPLLAALDRSSVQ